MYHLSLRSVVINQSETSQDELVLIFSQNELPSHSHGVGGTLYLTKVWGGTAQ